MKASHDVVLIGHVSDAPAFRVLAGAAELQRIWQTDCVPENSTNTKRSNVNSVACLFNIYAHVVLERSSRAGWPRRRELSEPRPGVRLLFAFFFRLHNVPFWFRMGLIILIHAFTASFGRFRAWLCFLHVVCCWFSVRGGNQQVKSFKTSQRCSFCCLFFSYFKCVQ